MLIGAYSTPTDTLPAAGAFGSGTSTSSSTFDGSPKALIIAPRIGIPFVNLVVAEIDKVPTRERTSGLL